MQRLYSTCFFILLLLLCLPSTWAMEVKGLNTADIPAVDQSRHTLKAALPQALNQVLIKMSGNPGVVTLPEIQNALPSIDNLVERYSYATKTDASGKQQRVLHVVFDAAGVKQLLNHASQAIWGSDRPLSLLWLAVPEKTQTTVLSSDDANPLTAFVKKTAASRGIPILFPTMDLKDQSNVTAQTTTLPLASQLIATAKRYDVHSILAGSITANSDGTFEGEWQLLLNGTPFEWQTSAANTHQVISNGINRAADMMANQLATIDSKNLQRTVMMSVNNVQNLDDYAHVVAELRQLATISKVTVDDMSNNTLLLELDTTGSTNALFNSLKQTHLSANAAPTDAGPHHVDLFYHWQNDGSTS